MAWQTPKMDWAAADGVRDSDMNRIEGNIQALYNEVGLRSALTLYVNASSGNDNAGNGSASAPYKTIMKAVRSLPKNLGGYNASINIAAGTYFEAVSISGLSGSLNLTGATDAVVEVLALNVSACVVLVSSITLKASSASDSIAVTNGGTLLCTSGNLTVVNSALSGSGVIVNNMSQLYVANTLSITGTGGGVALQCMYGSVAHINTLSGSGKANGIEASNGGKVSYTINSFIASGVLLTTTTGGRIYAAAQASVPSY